VEIKAGPLYNGKLICIVAHSQRYEHRLGEQNAGAQRFCLTLKIYTFLFEESDEIRFKKIEKMGTLMGTLGDKSL
jgi:hypothetical protein